MAEKEIDLYYRRIAKDFTDMLFNKNFLAPDLSRQTVDGLEEYMAFLFQSHCDSAVQCDRMLRRLKSEQLQSKA